MRSDALLLGLCAITLFGCDKLESISADEPAKNDEPAQTEPTAKPEAPAAAKENAPSASIEVEIADFQIFHPFSKSRALQSVEDDDTFSTRPAAEYYGAGAVVEATNKTGQVLAGAWFEGELRFVGARETVSCKLEASRIGDGYTAPETTHLSYDPPPDNQREGRKSDWRNEAGSTDEAAWRPDERIRMIARTQYCAAPELTDLGVQRIEGEIVVKAVSRFADRFEREFEGADYELSLVGDTVRIKNKKSSRVVAVPVDEANKRDGVHVVEMSAPASLAADGKPLELGYVRLSRAIDTWGEAGLVESHPVPLKLPPQTLTLQRVALPTGESAFASANLLVFPHEGKIKREDMSRAGLALLTADATPLPDKAPAVSFQADELSGRVTAVNLAHFADESSLDKGERLLTVGWQLDLAGGGIDTRLRAELDKAQKAVENAEAAAGGSDDAAAKAAVTQAKAARTAAEAKYQSSRATERGRLAGLFPCAAVKLVTNRRELEPSNKKDAGEACKTLKSQDAVAVSLSYELDRYELPIALAFQLGQGGLRFEPIATSALTKIDPR